MKNPATRIALTGVISFMMMAPFPNLLAQQRQIEEIVVTAQKRTESLQSVGLSVTALSSEDLVTNEVVNIQDLGDMAPNLTIGESFGFAQVVLRGVGTDNPFAGGDPSVAMHIDGVVTGQSSAQLGSLFDMQRIEVVRGPQGTLYGRNATGGSINVITNKPTETLSGYSRFTLGNYNLVKYEGAVSGSLTDNLLGRVAVRRLKRGGYGENIANGNDIDNADMQSFRAQLQWLATDDLDVRLAVEHHSEDDKNYIAKFRGPSYPDAPIPALEPQPQSGTRASDPRDINANTLLQNKRSQWSYTGEVNWAINEQFDLVSITNYQTFQKTPHLDFDMTDVAFYAQSESFETDQFSEELRLHFDNGPISGLVGLYYFNETIDSNNRLHQSIPVPPCGPPTNNLLEYPDADLCFHFKGDSEADASAIFANLDWAFADDFSLILGGRYSSETRSGDTERWIVPGMTSAVTFSDERSFDKFTPSVRLEWTPRDNLMTYGSYSQGFKSGIMLTGQTSPVLDPETVDAYEVGMKGQFLDQRLQLNSAIFHYDYSDLQQGISVPAGATGFTLVYENVASAEINGAEVEANWLATDQLQFDMSATYLDAEFSDYLSVDPFDTVFAQLGLAPTPTPEQLAGNSMVQAPEWTWSLAGSYDFVAPYNDWRGRATVSASYKDRVYFSQFNHEELSQEGVTTVDANVRFTSPDEVWSLNLWGKNLTDELIYVGTFIINGSRTNAGFTAPPRTLGATLGYNF